MTISDSESTFIKGNKSGFWKKYQRRTGAGGYPFQKQGSLLKNPGKINNLNKHQTVCLFSFIFIIIQAFSVIITLQKMKFSIKDFLIYWRVPHLCSFIQE